MDREVQVASGYLYRIVLTGERDPQWEPNVDRLLALENVADVTDHTRPGHGTGKRSPGSIRGS